MSWLRIVLGIALLHTASLMAAGGEVVTIAGTGVKGTAPDGAAAATSPIGEPYGLVIGPDGGLYVCEIANHLLRHVDLKTGVLRVVAGNGQPGYAGVGGPAREALLLEPYEVRFDAAGNLLFVDMKNAVVQRVDRQTQVLTTVAGTGKAGFSGDGGLAAQAELRQPHSIALDREDNIYICDIGNKRVRRVDAKTGGITTFAGGGKNSPGSNVSPLADLSLNGPRAMDFDGRHGFALALREGNAIFWVDLERQTLKHLAGTGKQGYAGDGGDARKALLSGPKGVAITSNGDIFFADTESHTIRVVRAKSGTVETAVGDGKKGDGPDGDPLHCRLARPHGVCADAQGNIYIGDSENHRVRVLRVH
jgi:sugar lactone lactonase YvrE